MAKLFHLRPLLWTDDVRATIDWYVTILRFSETAYSEDWQWGEVEKDGAAIMFSQPNTHLTYDGPRFTGSLYMATDDVEALWQALKDNPHVYYGLETFAYGMKEFAIKDCNGYILQFGQDVQA